MKMAARLDKLEAGKSAWSPKVKAWLGQPLTASERGALDDRAGIDADFDELDLAGLSPEIREWLAL